MPSKSAISASYLRGGERERRGEEKERRGGERRGRGRGREMSG
jgi:hypothetical protein